MKTDVFSPACNISIVFISVQTDTASRRLLGKTMFQHALIRLPSIK